MQLTFCGAAREVTGSMHEITVGGHSYLLDCGLYQGRRKEAEERNRKFPFPGNQISAVMLSHAHIDHSGNLPLLVHNGFHGPIYTSAATADLCGPMLADSAHLQEMDTMFINKRNLRKKTPAAPPIKPLYTTQDAQAVVPLFRPVPMHTRTEIGPGLSYTSFEAGHILGSTFMLLDLEDAGKKARLVFSGDLGRKELPILRDPELPPPADYLIVESTYGDRLHAPVESVLGELADIVKRTYARGGKMIVPAFAVGRTQQLVLMLHQLIEAGRIPAFPIFVDSPLAVNVTEVFRKHAELFDEEARKFVMQDEDPFGFSRLRYIRDVNESKALNDLHGPFMVISASGMCEGGRILHHLKNNIGDPRNTVLLTGYQAENTLGKKIEMKLQEVPVFGEMMPLRAEVVKLDALSGHADQHDLIEWIRPLAPTLKRVFLVHGEAEQQDGMASKLREVYGLEVVVPKRGDAFPL
jgi:metallo-beta-lactamase family protein